MYFELLEKSKQLNRLLSDIRFANFRGCGGYTGKGDGER